MFAATRMGVANRVSCDVVAGASSVNEGSSISFSITTGGIPEGASLTWDVSRTSSDFSSASSGSVTVTNGAASVSLTISSDSTTEGSETFTLRVYLGSALVGESATITINDTSTSYVPPPPPPPSFSFNLQHKTDSGSWVNTSGDRHTVNYEIPWNSGAISKNFTFRYYKHNSASGTVYTQLVRRPSLSDLSWSPATTGGNALIDTSIYYYPGDTLTLNVSGPQSFFTTGAGQYTFQVWSPQGEGDKYFIGIYITVGSA